MLNRIFIILAVNFLIMDKSKLLIIFVFITISTFFSACKSDNNSVPYVYVNFEVYLGDAQFSQLNAPGNSAEIINEGYKGIIIYRKSTDEFMIYDKCCTNDPTNKCEIVELTEESYVVKCACCE